MRLMSLVFSLLLTRQATAELTIFDVRRNLPLGEADKVFHDYLVDGGAEAGLKLGMQLAVTRRLPIYDYYRFRSVGDLQLKVAKVKVIAVQDGIAVVRLREDFPRDDNAILEDNFVMVGDKLDLTTVVADNPTPAGDVVAASPAAVGPVVPQIVVNSVDIGAPTSAAAQPSRKPAAIENNPSPASP